MALIRKATLVAIDDRRGIKACKLLRIPFTTAVGIVKRMKERQFLTKEQALAKVEALARYGRYSAEIISKAKADMEKQQ